MLSFKTLIKRFDLHIVVCILFLVFVAVGLYIDNHAGFGMPTDDFLAFLQVFFGNIGVLLTMGMSNTFAHINLVRTVLTFFLISGASYLIFDSFKKTRLSKRPVLYYLIIFFVLLILINALVAFLFGLLWAVAISMLA